MLVAAEIATEIAIQMKTSLSFVLGLGGLFSIVRSFMIAAIFLGELPDETKRIRPSLAREVRNARRGQFWLFATTTVLFLLAVVLYVGPLREINAIQLASGGATLTKCQIMSVFGIVLIVILVIVIDTFAMIRRRRLEALIA